MGCQPPDPYEDHGTDPIEALVEQSLETLTIARKAYATNPSREQWAEVVRCREAYEKVLLNAWGVECDKCGGSGKSLLHDFRPGVCSSPQRVYTPCLRCYGSGAFLPADRVHWRGR